MKPYFDSAVGGPGNGVGSLAPSVSAVYDLQSGVVRTFGSVFHHNEASSGYIGYRVEHIVGYAIGASAYYQAEYVGLIESVTIKPEKVAAVAVGVGIGLEICQITHLRILSGEKFFAFGQLGRYVGRGRTIRGVE